MVKKIEGKKCPAFKGDSTSGLTLSNKDFDGKNYKKILKLEKKGMLNKELIKPRYSS